MNSVTKSRATVAQQALEAVNRFRGASDLIEDNDLAGLLADFRHWCDAHEVDFAKIDRRAYQHYAAEKGGAA
jgi:hypothetical protein